MEFFNNAKAVRLKSHLDKYLTASEDQLTVHQTREGSSKGARWAVELVQSNPHAIRLKSCYGSYLTASDNSFLLGLTGKKVQLKAFSGAKRLDFSTTEWEPIKEGYNKVRFRTKAKSYLRGNGATQPWRNTVTHDFPQRTATQDWVLWEVEVVDVSALADVQYLPNNEASCSSTIAAANKSTDDGKDHSSSSNKVVNHSFVNEDDRDSGGSHHPPSSSSLASADLERRMVCRNNHRWLSVVSDHHHSPMTSPRSKRQDGMEFFDKAKLVRLQGHHGKYLFADEDEKTVRQSSKGSSHGARWMVELIGANKIGLKSFHGLYLTASEEAFLLGMMGKKVLQTQGGNRAVTEWEPVKEGDHRVKLVTWEGKFLRANGGTPPWKNSVTHDVPQRTATQEWVMWGVDILRSSVDIAVDGSSRLSCSVSSASSCSDSPLSRDDGCESSSSAAVGGGSVVARFSSGKSGLAEKVSGMEFFKKAMSVRLRSHHNKYLTAEPDEETVVQDRSGTSKSVKWTVEFVEGVENVVRLKSCYGKYLKATDEEFLLGVTGRKVVQALPRKIDSSVEWEPIRDGMQVKLKTRYGNFLRANGGLPPWRNSITHDIPHRHHDWVLWDVDVVEIRPRPPPKVFRTDSLDEDVSAGPIKLRIPSHVKNDAFHESPRKSEGRLIYYYVADDEGEVNDAIEGPSFQFVGHGLEELTQRLEEETGLEDIIVCSRSLVNGRLYPLRLALPPNNSTMHVVVIPPTSKAANDFLPAA